MQSKYSTSVRKLCSKINHSYRLNSHRTIHVIFTLHRERSTQTQVIIFTSKTNMNTDSCATNSFTMDAQDTFLYCCPVCSSCPAIPMGQATCTTWKQKRNSLNRVAYLGYWLLFPCMRLFHDEQDETHTNSSR